MEEEFKIFVDRLRHGEVEEIDESYDPAFMQIQDKDLSFLEPIKVQGEAYIAENELVLLLNIDTECLVPCRICNNPVAVKIALDGHYHVVPLNEIKGGIYSVKDHIRETLLLEAPHLTECEGSCPERKELTKYFSKPDKTELKPKTYQPFQDLKMVEDENKPLGESDHGRTT